MNKLSTIKEKVVLKINKRETPYGTLSALKSYILRAVYAYIIIKY